MPKVVFVKEKKDVEVPAGAILRQEAIKAGIQVNFEVIDTATGVLGRYLNCRGFGLCGTCRVLVKKGMENLSDKGAIERFTLGRMFSAIGHEDEMRLACQVKVNGDCTIETRPEFNLSGQTDSKGKHFWETPYPNK